MLSKLKNFIIAIERALAVRMVSSGSPFAGGHVRTRIVHPVFKPEKFHVQPSGRRSSDANEDDLWESRRFDSLTVPIHQMTSLS